MPPSDQELIDHFLYDGEVDRALGEFVRLMVDAGYAVTIVGYEVDCWSETLKIWQHRDWTYVRYRTHTRLTVSFDCSPPPIEESSPWEPTGAWIAAVVAVIIAIGISAGVFFALRGLTTTEKTYKIHHPDCTTEEITETGPPEWWPYVIIIVGAVTVIAVVPSVFGFLRRPRTRAS